MAVIKAKVIKYGSVGKLIYYIGDSKKTDDCEFITGIHCSPDTRNVELDMQQIKNIYNKKNGILGVHVIQSFKPGEVSAELAHEIGVQMAKDLWGDRFQIYVGTHLDRNHIHNHIFINSVSFRDGKKLHWNKTEYFNTRATSDRFCKECGLSTIDSKDSQKFYNATKIYADRFMKTNPQMVQLRQDIDDAIYLANSFQDFVNVMGTFGYDVCHEKSWDWNYYFVINRTTHIRYSPDSLFGKEYKRIGTEDRIWANKGLKRDTYLEEGISKAVVLSFYTPQILAFEIFLLIIVAVLEIAINIQEENRAKNIIKGEVNFINDKNEQINKEISSQMTQRAEKIVEVNNLLSENKIASENDLNEFMSTVTLKIGKLRNTKENLLTYVRKNGSNDELNDKIENITKEIDELNKKIKIVNFINGELRKIKATKLALEKERDNTILKQAQEKEIKKMKKRDAR